MKTNLKDFGHFTKTQITGILSLSGLMLGAFFLVNIYSIPSPKASTDFTKIEKEITEFEKILADTKKSNTQRNNLNTKSKIPLFNFDPNTVSKEALLKLGLSATVAKTFINYRNTGAKFYKKEDLKKVYGLKKDYQRLAPYIIIEQTRKIFPIKPSNKTIKKPIKRILTPFKFNPNEADKTTLLQLGLSSKVVQTILNYRKSGAQFWKKEDFQKIYGLTQKDYSTLAPYIDIPRKVASVVKKTSIPKNIPKNYSTSTSIKVDINNSTIEDWKQLKGIGEITAKRIINYRDKLRGFVSIEQLKTTYNIADSTIDNVAHQLIVSPIVSKIPINTISAEALKMHPYIKKKQAYLIVNYRMNHGNYERLADLQKVGALTPDFIQRIAPYLSFE